MGSVSIAKPFVVIASLGLLAGPLTALVRDGHGPRSAPRHESCPSQDAASAQFRPSLASHRAKFVPLTSQGIAQAVAEHHAGAVSSGRIGPALGKGTVVRRVLCCSIAMILVLALGVTTSPAGPPTAAAAPSAAGGKPACVADRPDRTSAALTARLCGGRVEVAGLQSETTRVYANPNGSFTAQVYRAPVRTRQGNTWVPVDLTLRRGADGTVTPVAHPNGLSLAGAAAAGTHDVASMNLGGDRVGVSWTGALAAPVLDGATATYRDVRPGVDLVITATRTGSEQFFVIKTREAAAQAATLTAPLHGSATTFEPDPGGGVVLKDKAGQPVGRSPAPLMWDASTSPVTGEHTRVATLPTGTRTRAAGRAELLTAPDQNWLADPATRYPVTIDPQVNAGTLFDTYVKTNEDIDRSGANDLHVGFGSGQVARSFVQWDASQFVGTQITAATVNFWNWYSASCTASSWDIWTTDPTDGSARWTHQPAWRFKEAVSTATHGFSTSCDDNWSAIDGKAFFQRAADSGTAGPFMGIRATTESDTNSWKQFRSRNAASAATVPYAVVTYNRRPEVSAVSTAPPAPCVTGTGRPYVNSVTPTLQATVTDADASTVRARFQWWNTGGSMIGEAMYPGGLLATGTTFSAAVPAGAFSGGGTYSWRALGNDGLTDGTWSPWCEFTIDTAAPGTAPTVSSTAYPTGVWTPTVGRPGDFTLGPAGVADVASYLYGLDQNPPTTAVNPAALGGSATVSLAPATAGPHTLYVRSRDRAGNLSPVASYGFAVGAAAVTAPIDGDTVVRDVVLAAAGPAAMTGATFQYRRAPADPWTEIPAADVHRRADGAAVTWPVPVTNGTTPDLLWAAGNTVAGRPLLQVRAVLNSASGPAAADPVRLTVDPLAATAATDTVGPGTLNLASGDLRITAQTPALGVAITRTASSRAPLATQGDLVPAFGPQWQWGYTVGGLTGVWLRQPTPNTAEVITAAGVPQRFALDAAGQWQPQPGSEQLALGYDQTADRFTITDTTSGGYLTFAKVAPVTSGYAVVSSGTPAANSTTTYTYDTVAVSGGPTLVRPRRIVLPTTAAAAATCAATPATRGCRVVELLYATSTTATANSFGDVTGRLARVQVWTTAPGASASTSITLAQYAYDAAGRLRQAWDPRLSSPLTTRYDYDDSGRVTTVAAPGVLPWTLTYGVAGTLPASGPGMLLAASHPTLTPGTADQQNGTATTTVVYDVPTTTAQNGPYDLSGAQVSRWAQQVVPGTAVAVFPPDAVPAGNVGRGHLTTGSYTRASVTYLDRNGRSVNEASPGGHLTSTEYDRLGHPVRLLLAANIDLALGQGPDAAGRLNRLGLSNASTAQRALLLSSTTAYGANGIDKVEEAGPVHIVTLLRAAPGAGGLPDLPAGSQMPARTRTVTAYDQNRPADGTARTAHQPTRRVIGAAVSGYPADADTQVNATEYDWALGLPTRTIDDPDGQAAVHSTRYDDQGRVIETRAPAATGTDAGTTLTSYYTAAGTAPCGGRPEWADLTCRTGPGGPITDAGTNPTELTTTTTTYTALGNPATVAETANGTTRTTTTSYDAADRVVTVSVAGGTGDPVPDTLTSYDPANGQVSTTSAPTGAQISNAYDQLGRLIAYTDAAGATTRYQYDDLDRNTLAIDANGSRTTYAYDTSIEPRGLLTSTTDSVAGTVTARYDADGNLVSQALPGGVTQTTGLDPTDQPVSQSYTTSAGATIFSEQLAVSSQGQWVEHTGLTTQTFAVDALGRIVEVEDGAENVCTRRTYTYGTANLNTDRVAKTTEVGDPGAGCPGGSGAAASGKPLSATAGTTTETHSYDSADRITDPGYGYDALGRTTSMPGGLQLAYRADDQLRQQTAGTVRQTWNSDPAQRPSAYQVETNTTGAWTTVQNKVNHYRDDSDRPAYTVEDTGTGAITRNVTGNDGQLVATTSATGDLRLQLTNLHGDVTVVYDPATAAVDVNLTDEFGVPQAGSVDMYGWLGADQRSGEALGNTMLMGARVYHPATGRFLQTDPIVGGNANAYDYCSGDPNMCTDTTGLGGCWLYFICGMVTNDSRNVMWAGDIYGNSGGNCRGYGYFPWGTIHNYKCHHYRVSPHGGRLGGFNRPPGWGGFLSRYDVDLFTFPNTHYHYWGVSIRAGRYMKIPTGDHARCTSTWWSAPWCS